MRTPLPPRCLSVKETAGVLGLSPSTVQGLVNSGKLTALRMIFGSRKVYRIQKTDLEAYIEKTKAGAVAAQDTVIEIPNFE